LFVAESFERSVEAVDPVFGRLERLGSNLVLMRAHFFDAGRNPNTSKGVLYEIWRYRYYSGG
jgi:hypothetical protein